MASPPWSPCFHDTLITIGAFSLTNREMTLTVVAAILTLIGYSMNDTIVVFDRIRENLRLVRRAIAVGDCEPEHQPDAEQNRADLRPDVFDRPVSISVWRGGAEWLFIRAGDRHPDRNVFLDCGGGADAGGLSGLARPDGARRLLCRPGNGRERKCRTACDARWESRLNSERIRCRSKDLLATIFQDPGTLHWASGV